MIFQSYTETNSKPERSYKDSLEKDAHIPPTSEQGQDSDKASTSFKNFLSI